MIYNYNNYLLINIDRLEENYSKLREDIDKAANNSNLQVISEAIVSACENGWIFEYNCNVLYCTAIYCTYIWLSDVYVCTCMFEMQIMLHGSILP